MDEPLRGLERLERAIPMTGTFINIASVILGSVVGIVVGARLPERMRSTVMDGLGLATMAIGLKMSLDTTNAVIMIGSLVLGGVLGEIMDLDGAVTRLGETMERLVLGRKQSDEGTGDDRKGRFAKGFVAASLLFCIGPMAIMGSIQDGLSGDYTMLSVKSMLDGFMSVLFASSFGIGVAFSILPLALYQGAITLLAGLLNNFLTEAMIAEFTATGGILVFAIGLGIVGIKKVKVANLLPGVFLAPIIVYIVATF